MECFEIFEWMHATHANRILFFDDERQFESYGTKEIMGHRHCDVFYVFFSHLFFSLRKWITLSLSKRLWFAFPKSLKWAPSNRCESQSTTMESHSAKTKQKTNIQHLSAKLCQVKCNFYAHKIMLYYSIFVGIWCTWHFMCVCVCVCGQNSITVSSMHLKRYIDWEMNKMDYADGTEFGRAVFCRFSVPFFVLFHIRVDTIEQLMKCVFFSFGGMMQTGKGIKATKSNAIVKSNSLENNSDETNACPQCVPVCACSYRSKEHQNCIQYLSFDHDEWNFEQFPIWRFLLHPLFVTGTKKTKQIAIGVEWSGVVRARVAEL